MSYDSFEKSNADSAPIECYKFTGTFETFRYTSYESTVTVDGETYVPIPISRKAVKTGTHNDDALDLELEMPYDTGVIQAYAYQYSPPTLSLEIRRVHRTTDFAVDSIILWKGEVSSFSVSKRKARVRVPSIFARALNASLPSLYYQNQCNNLLGDVNCAVALGTFTLLTHVLLTTTDTLTTVLPMVSGLYVSGEVINSGTNERRMIIANTTTVLTLSYPFTQIAVGDPVSVVQGCDHSFSQCGSKFSNQDNYGGHPYIPDENPFEGEL